MARFSRPGDGPKAPAMASGLRIESVQIAAMRRIAAGDAGDDHVLDNQGRRCDAAAALLGILYFNAPNFFSGLPVDRDNVIIQRPHKDQPVGHSHAAVPGAVKRRDEVGLRIGIAPQHLAAGGVQGEDMVPGCRDVHHTVNDQRGRLHAAVGDSAFKGPHRSQTLDVRAIYLVQGAVPPALIRTVVRQPVFGFLIRASESFGVDFGARK